MSDDVWMPPEIIYLVRDEDGPWESSEVCWCSERINDTDVEYRRVPAPDAPVDAIRWLVDRFGEDDPLLPYSPAGRALIQSIRDWLAQRTK